MSDRDCVICKIVADERDPSFVYEDDRTVAFMDANPVTPGHVVVAPRRHSADLLEVDADDLASTVRAAQRVATEATRNLHADGVNVASSWERGASPSSSHFHIHVIPRYEHDRLRLPWRPAAGVPDEIAAAAAALR